MTSAILKSDNTLCVGVLINPLSGKNRQDHTVISALLSDYPEVLQQRVRTVQDVYEALTEFSRRKVNLLVISGGDGTVQAALTVLFHHHPFSVQPQVIVLPGGTTNMIAGDVGIKGSQDSALQRLLQWILTGKGSVTRIERPVLRLQVPGHEVKYGMFFGAASISQGVQYYRRKLHNKRLRGIPGICLTLVRYLWGAIRQREQETVTTFITVSLDEQPLQEEEFMILFVTTLDQLFFGLCPFWGVESGRLRFTAVRSRAKYLLRVLPALSRGYKAEKGTRENGYYSQNVDRVELYIAESVALDGEVYTPESGQKPTLLEHGGNIIFLRV